MKKTEKNKLNNYTNVFRCDSSLHVFFVAYVIVEWEFKTVEIKDTIHSIKMRDDDPHRDFI